MKKHIKPINEFYGETEENNLQEDGFIEMENVSVWLGVISNPLSDTTASHYTQLKSVSGGNIVPERKDFYIKYSLPKTYYMEGVSNGDDFSVGKTMSMSKGYSNPYSLFDNIIVGKGVSLREYVNMLGRRVAVQVSMAFNIDTTYSIERVAKTEMLFGPNDLNSDKVKSIDVVITEESGHSTQLKGIASDRFKLESGIFIEGDAVIQNMRSLE